MSNPVPVDRERLRAAYARLRPIERQVYRLAAVEGLFNDQIARQLHIPPARVERILARAICKLDRMIGREDRSWWRFR